MTTPPRPHDDGSDRDEFDPVIAAALGHDEHRVPPAERIAEVRARAAARSAAAPHERPATALRSRRVQPTSRRELLVGGIAASFGAALGSGAVLVGRDDPPPGPPTEAIEFTGADVPIAAALIDHTWGTELLLDISDLPPDRDYHVAYLDSAGTSVAAGSFRSVAGVVMKCRFNAALMRADTAAIVIVDDSDAEVLRATLRA